MNYLYVDASVATSGDGSYGSPFKYLSDVFALSTLMHPVTVSLKRGLVYRGGNTDTNYLMYNTGSSQSYITAYGVGPDPVIAEEDTNDSSTVVMARARHITMSHIVHVGTMAVNAIASISPAMISGDTYADVWVEDCKFIAVGGLQQAWKPALWMSASTFVNDSVGGFGLRRTEFNGTARGTWLLGNSNVPSSATDNNGDRYYGQGIRAEDCSFINVGGDGCIISNACSADNPLSSRADRTTSGMFRLTYRSTRNDFPSTASIAFWLSNCNKVVMSELEVDGCMGAKNGYDKQAFDFDILCHDCLLEYSYSRNTSGFLITSNYASQVTAMPSTETAYSWYYTKGYGNKNNTVMYCTSFNDGCYVGRPKIIWQGYTFNLKFINCTFIDTVNTSGVLMSMFRDGTNLYTLTDGVYGAVFQNVLFYTPNATAIRLVSSDSGSGTAALTSVNSVLQYATSAVTPTWPSGGSLTNNIAANPNWLNLPASAPSLIERASKLRMRSSSPAINSGVANSVVDYNGKAGNSIGAIQY